MSGGDNRHRGRNRCAQRLYYDNRKRRKLRPFPAAPAQGQGRQGAKGLYRISILRGRVGRGQRESYCILIRNGPRTARLDALCRINDGFLIAEEDLKLRGPGDFFGHRQHGLPEFKAADLSSDMDLFRTGFGARPGAHQKRPHAVAARKPAFKAGGRPVDKGRRRKNKLRPNKS